MECISISHKTAEAKKRQRCFIPKENRKDYLQKIRELCGVEQCVVLSTCNRTEIYVKGRENRFRDLEAALAETAGSDAQWIRSLVRRYQGAGAIRHLFRVTCGMESMVIGEDEILGQVRDAYKYAKDAGYTGYELDGVFQAALSCAKRVKTETAISKSSVSVATLAANEVFRIPKRVKTVLLIGSTGQMGGIVQKNLLSQENIRVIATVRSHNGVCQSGNPRVENVDYRRRYEYLEEADAVVSATSSPHYTMIAKQVEQSIKTDKERLFVDISMPPDMDGDIGGIANCRLVTLDDINRLAQENNRRKSQALADAEEILAQEFDRICKVLAFHRFMEKDAGWKERYEGWSAQKLVYLLRDELDRDSFEAVLEVLGHAGWQ